MQFSQGRHGGTARGVIFDIKAGSAAMVERSRRRKRRGRLKPSSLGSHSVEGCIHICFTLGAALSAEALPLLAGGLFL